MNNKSIEKMFGKLRHWSHRTCIIDVSSGVFIIALRYGCRYCVEMLQICYLKLHNCFAYFNQKINSWRMVFYFFYFTAPVTELLRIKVFCFLILLSYQNKDLITAE